MLLTVVTVLAAGAEAPVSSDNGGADGSAFVDSDSSAGFPSGMLAAVGGTKRGKSPGKMVTWGLKFQPFM